MHPSLKSGIIENVAHWWTEARARWRRLHELQNLSSVELSRIAIETGLSEVELLRMASQPNGIPDLLARRLAALKLSPDEIAAISPFLERDLVRTCCNCTGKRQCADQLDAAPDAPDWKTYCPNADTLSEIARC